ncbi:MAG TPA: hypothetical protein DCS43_10700 [Verrucomicrobia bacterium]|nr:hypothetical protein [Verrucomicrobiota bacterium]
MGKRHNAQSTVKKRTPGGRSWSIVASGGLALLVGLFYAVAVWLGDLNQDEGWYLYAARLVHEGKHPFLDFASPQGPLMAYAYSVAYPLVQLAGVLGGRIFTALLGILTLLLAALLCRRMVLLGAVNDRRSLRAEANTSALLVAGLLGLNLYHVYFTSLVKTYGLAGLLTVLGFLGLETAIRSASGVSASGEGVAWRRLGAFGGGLLAAACFGMAAATRLSAGILLPAVWLPLAWSWLRNGRCRGGLTILAGMLAGGTAALAALYGPFLVHAPDVVRFGLLDYHSARQISSPLLLLIYKGGFLLRVAGFYFPLLVVAALGLAGWRRRDHADSGHCNVLARSLPRLCGWGLAGVTLVHLAAPFPYDDYQVFAMPLAVLLSVPPAVSLLFRQGWSPGRRAMAVAGAMALMMAHSLSSPLLQGWMVSGRDRIWWPLKTATPLQGLRSAAQQVTSTVAPDSLLLTQDTYLAVEAGLRVPDGMELGPFCFFPDLDDAQARRFHVLNANLLRGHIKSGQSAVVACSDWWLAIHAPRIVPVAESTQALLQQAIAEHYVPLFEIAKFGQGETRLRLYRRRETP